MLHEVHRPLLGSASADVCLHLLPRKGVTTEVDQHLIGLLVQACGFDLVFEGTDSGADEGFAVLPDWADLQPLLCAIPLLQSMPWEPHSDIRRYNRPGGSMHGWIVAVQL